MRAPLGAGTLLASRNTRFALVVALLCLAPAFGSGYVSGLITEVLIFAIAAMSLNLLMGYTGLVSFGHAAFFGVGAYTAIVLNAHFGIGAWTGAAVGIVLATLCAAVIGFFCLRLRGVAFFMGTLAFGQLLYSVSVKWRSVTGGSDGIGGLARPSLLGQDLSSPTVMYYFTLACFVAVVLALKQLIESQLGQSMIGIRENEMRMRALGYPTQRLKLVAFTIAGALGGVAGSLYALFNGFASPESLSWGTSGNLLLMVVLGGIGTLSGPVIGAAVFLLMKHFVSSHTDHWLLIIGVMFVLCVMFFRQGIYGAGLKAMLGREQER